MKKVLALVVLCAVAAFASTAHAADMHIEICVDTWHPPCQRIPPVTTAVPPTIALAPAESYSLNFKGLSRQQVEFILHAIGADPSKVDLSGH